MHVERVMHVAPAVAVFAGFALACGPGQVSVDPDAARATDGGVASEADGDPGADAAAAIDCSLEPKSEPQKKAIFVDEYPDNDLTIEDAMVELIGAAVPGSEIRIAVFTWTRKPISEALIAAHERGVDVRAIADQANIVEDPEGSGEYRLRSAVQLVRDALGEERMVICNESVPPNGLACIGDGINHNKILLFSELCDGSKDVVVQSSANFTNPQLAAHNNSVIIRDDPALFDAYETYWNDLHAQQTDLNYYWTANGDTGTQAHFSPRPPSGDEPREPETDTVYRILRDVECTEGSRIRMSMAIWTGPRVDIVDILASKKAEGCDVKIIAGESGTTDFVKGHLTDAFSSPGDLVFAEGMHHKYFLVDATYEGKQRRLVFTGSHNLTGPALRRNDEVLLRVEDGDIFEAFIANWNAIYVAQVD